MNVNIFLIGTAYFIFVAVTSYILMKVELNKKGRQVTFLNTGSEGLADTVKAVFAEYRKLKHEEKSKAILPLLSAVSAGLAAVCVVVSLILFIVSRVSD